MNPTKRRMSRGLVLALTALVVGGCSIVDPLDDKGVPVPADLVVEEGTTSLPDPAESAKDDRDRSVSAVLRYALERKALIEAKRKGTISSTCEETSPKQYTCTVTFDGVPAKSTIAIQSVSPAGTLQIVRYQITSHEMVVTRHAVLVAMNQLVENSRKQDKKPYINPRCDADIPDVQVVPEKARLDKGRCYAIRDGWGELTKEYYISALSGGPALFHK